ncbi:MAG: TlpA family protein disulfide reductase [Gammaproteobacteria bacterium]
MIRTETTNANALPAVYHRTRRMQSWIFLAWLFLCPLAHAEPVEFSLADTSGENHRLSDYRGQWVVLNFWATWCGPCIEEIPNLNQFHERWSARESDDPGTPVNRAMVIGINFEYPEIDALRNFIQRYAINYPVLRIEQTPLVPFEPLKGLPSTFLVNPQGEYVARHIGPINLEQLEAMLHRAQHAAGLTR